MNTHSNIFLEYSNAIIGKVKWFDATKGFGFVVASGYETDFLLHQHVLQSFGRSSIANETFIEFIYDDSPTGFKIAEVISIKATEHDVVPTAVAEPDHLAKEFVPARVKWFDLAKGYGFVNQFGGSEDVFIGSSVLQYCGLQSVMTGEAVCVEITETGGRKSVRRVQDWVCK